MDSLIIYIQRIIIASDETGSNQKSDVAWIIATEEGEEIFLGYNSDFGDITQINSHKAEIFGTLAVLLFLREFSWFFKIEIQSEVEY